MKITVKNIIVGEYGFIGDRAELEVEGLGNVTIQAKLPDDLRADVESFYKAEYYRRTKNNRVPTNPQTHTDKGESL